ncbi:MAG: zinc ribbon domain-containing protein [bacterium]|nr:zinc ribbon domain-containing protein [bacterium]
MPLYEYWCKDCRKSFTQLKSISELNQRVQCPTCQSKRVQRVLSNFSTSGQLRTSGRGFTALNKSDCKTGGG